jgi:hypothetical protein
MEDEERLERDQRKRQEGVHLWRTATWQTFCIVLAGPRPTTAGGPPSRGVPLVQEGVVGISNIGTCIGSPHV